MAETYLDNNLTLNSRYKVKDLTVTQTGIDNKMPEKYLGGAKSLANVLDLIYREVGPFYIDSAFRSEAVNAKVGGESTSRHLYAEAADIVPTGMKVDEFFGKILANKTIANDLGEISVKTNTVHLTTPYYNASGKYIVASPRQLVAGIYSSLSLDDIKKFTEPYVKAISATTQKVTKSIEEFTENPKQWFDNAFNFYDEFGLLNPKPFILGSVALIGALGVYLLAKDEKTK